MLNLGCGLRQRKGFINVDNYVEKSGKAKFVKADIRKLPFENDYADYVEMMSVLEHIPFNDVLKVLAEISRVMKPGAELVIQTENFDGIALDWARMCMEGWNPQEYMNVMETVYGNQRHEGEFHKTAFNPRFMDACLRAVGFRIKSMANYPKNSPIPEFGTVPADPKRFLRSDQLLAVAIK